MPHKQLSISLFFISWEFIVPSILGAGWIALAVSKDSSGNLSGLFEAWAARPHFIGGVAGWKK